MSAELTQPHSLFSFASSGRPAARVGAHGSRRRGRGSRRRRAPPRAARRSVREPDAARAGQLDPTFGVAGAANSNLFALADAAVQADGKVVVVGTKVGRNGVNDFAVARFNADGSPDSGFGAGGIDVTPLFIGGKLYPAVASAVTVQPGGKIVVVGNVGPGVNSDGSPGPIPRQFAAVRYDANGTVDPTFGVNGQATAP